MHMMIPTFSEMSLGAADAPGITSADIARCAVILRDAATGESDDILSIRFLEFALSPTLPSQPILDDRIIDAADYFEAEIAKLMLEEPVPPSNTFEARRILLSALANREDLAEATRAAIRAVQVEKMTSRLAGVYSDVNPLELPTPHGIVLIDRAVDLDASIMSGDSRVFFRVGLRPYVAGGLALELTSARYLTLGMAKAALLMVLDDSVPARAH